MTLGMQAHFRTSRFQADPFIASGTGRDLQPREHSQYDITVTSKHLHLVILQTLLSKATYNWGIHEAIHLEEANIQRKRP